MMLHFYDICVQGTKVFNLDYITRGNIYIEFCTIFREFNVEKARTMLDETIHWREKFDVENICKHWKGVIEVENATGKAYVRGHDKEGRSIVVLRPSAENTFDHDGNIKHLVYTMERAVKCTNRNGQEKLSLLIDFDGYSIFNAPSISTSHHSIRILQDHYPERLHRAYFIHPPSIFYGLFKILHPFIDAMTLDKVRFLSNEDMLEPDNSLFRDIDKSVLETTFGGTDHRPFRSQKYLHGKFDEDYLTILMQKKTKAPH